MIEQALLQEIQSAPDDDMPRLIYADWAEDQGDSDRAELIRVQLALARLPDGDPATATLRQRENDLLTRNRRRWSERMIRLGAGWPGFVRGMIEMMEIDAAHFLKVADRLFAESCLRDLGLIDPHNSLQPLARCEPLARLHTLRLVHGTGTTAPLPAPGLRVLFGSPHLALLRTLDLTGCRIGPAQIAALAGSRLQPIELGLQWNGIDREALLHLLHSSVPERIEVLDLRDNAITNECLNALSRSPLLSQLRVLRLEGNDITEAGIVALLDSPIGHGLRRLTCSARGLSQATIDRLQARFSDWNAEG